MEGELAMARTIYRFYCYQCMKDHESTVPYHDQAGKPTILIMG